MKVFSGFGFPFSVQGLDAAADAEGQTRKVQATPPAAPVKPHLSTPGSGPRHHRNFTNLPQLRDHPLSSLVNARTQRKIGGDVPLAARENNARGIEGFAAGELKNVPAEQRLAWLRNQGADLAMHETMRHGSAEDIMAWMQVVELLPEASRYAFLGEKIKKSKTDHDDRNSIATGIFNNTQVDAMKAWGKLLELVPDRNRERSKLLLARMDHAAGTPGVALLFERGEKQALDQFVGLATQHVWHGDEDIHHVLFDCLPALKILTSQRGQVSGIEAQDWVRPDGLKYTNPHELSINSQETAQAFGKLMRLVPGKYRNDLLFPQEIWADFPDRNGDAKQLSPDQARELAHSITLLKAMVPGMSAEERLTVLNEIRSRHATKTMGFWKNTSRYEKFKRRWPAVDAMLLDLKAELKKAPMP